MQNSGMHETGGARRAIASNGLGRHLGGNGVADRSREHPSVPMLIKRTFMTARHHFQRPVFFRHIIKKKQYRHHVIIGVRFKEKILMKLDLGCRARQLGVDLGIFKLDIGAQKVF